MKSALHGGEKDEETAAAAVAAWKNLKKQSSVSPMQLQEWNSWNSWARSKEWEEDWPITKSKFKYWGRLQENKTKYGDSVALSSRGHAVPREYHYQWEEPWFGSMVGLQIIECGAEPSLQPS